VGVCVEDDGEEGGGRFCGGVVSGFGEIGWEERGIGEVSFKGGSYH